MKNQHVCEYCHGVLHSTRRVSLALTIEHHEDACPAGLRVKRKPAPPVEPPPAPRKRIIPRQVL